jgi:hypothetical protein
MLRLYFGINVLYSIIVRVKTDIGYFAELGYKSSNILKIFLIFKKYSYNTRVYLIGLSSRLYFLSRGHK